MHRSRILGSTALMRSPNDAGGGAPVPVPSATPSAPAPSNPDPAPAASASSAAAPVPPAPGAEPPPAAPAAAPASDWKDRRIAELTAKLNEAKRTVAAPAPTPAAGETEAEFQARVDAAATEKATQMAAVNDWNNRCEDVFAKGKAEFPDFQDKVGALQKEMNPQDPLEVNQYTEVLAAAMETGQAHKVLADLAATPGQMQELMRMTPVKRAVKLAGLAVKHAPVQGEPDPSAAPKPIVTVGGRGVHYDGIKPDDKDHGTKLPMAEWMRQREKQVEERGIQ